MRILTILFTLTFVISCVETGTPEDLIFQETAVIDNDPQVEITYLDIKENIIEPFGCVRCHSGWANSESGVMSRIVAGEPFSSPFYLRMENGSMPLGGPSVDSSRLEYVEKFIRQLE